MVRKALHYIRDVQCTISEATKGIKPAHLPAVKGRMTTLVSYGEKKISVQYYECQPMQANMIKQAKQSQAATVQVGGV